MTRRKIVVGTLLALLAVVAGAAWTWRENIQAWYLIRQLTHADESERDRLAERVANLGDAAVPGLLGALSRADAASCDNLRPALDRIGSRGSPFLLRQIAERWSTLPSGVRCMLLESSVVWLHSASGGEVVPAATTLLTAAKNDDDDIRSAALLLCDCLTTMPGAAAVREPGCELVRACLQSESPALRLRAIQTSRRPGIDAIKQVALLLRDPEVEVRRAALAVVGPPDEAVPDEMLLPCLHDADPEIRKQCEEALVERGLQPIQIKLGRLISAPQFLTRIQVLEELGELDYLEQVKNIESPVDSGAWMCRLSHDPMPSVRAAAAWALSRKRRDDCTRRLTEMAGGDPSPTVCMLAAYYLKQARE